MLINNNCLFNRPACNICIKKRMQNKFGYHVELRLGARDFMGFPKPRAMCAYITKHIRGKKFNNLANNFNFCEILNI